MTAKHTIPTQVNNPLYDKMCARFLLQGNRTIGEVMLKKAARYKERDHTEAYMQARRSRPSLGSCLLLRASAICVSVCLLAALLVGCVYLGKQNNSLFEEIAGVYSSEQAPEAVQQQVNTQIYESEEGSTTVTVFD